MKKDNEKRVPELRFKGFDRDWEQRKLKQIFKRFIVPMRDKPSSFSGNIPWTRVEDVQGKYLGASLSGLCVSTETVQKMHLQVFPKASIAVTISATFGVVAITTRDIVTNQRFIGLVPDKGNDVDFLYELCKSPTMFKQMKIESAGSVHFYITRHQMENFRVNVPAFAEQLKMSGLLNTLDKAIALHELKLDLLKRLKKAYLQQLFPENGHKAPKLRFAGFIDDWEQHKLGEIFNTITDYVANGSFKSIRDNVQSSTYPDFAYLVRLQDASNKWNGPWLYTNRESYDFLKKTALHPGDIIMSNVGTVGKFIQIPALDRPMTLAPNAVLIRSSYYPQHFLFQLMNSGLVANAILEKKTPGVQSKINKTDFKSINVEIPDLEEAKHIGTLLDELDTMVTLQEQRLENLHHLKQAYLQKLFV